MHQIIKTDFIYAESRSTLEGSAYIISMNEPFFIGTVHSYTNDMVYLSILSTTSLWFAVVPGYRIIIQITGSIASGKRISVDPDTVDVIQGIANQMAEYFFKERCLLHQKYYSKFEMK